MAVPRCLPFAHSGHVSFRAHNMQTGRSSDSLKMQGIRVVAVSDTHGEHQRISVPAGDLLIYAGDLALRGDNSHLLSGLDWFANQPHACKILVAGNHDHGLDPSSWLNKLPWQRNNRESVLQKLQKYSQSGAMTYLHHETAQVEVAGRSLKVFGSGYTHEHGPGALRYKLGEDPWSDSIPNDADLVITHGPPLGFLDLNRKGMESGCRFLRQKIEQVRPSLHVFGHIHQAHGVLKHSWECQSDVKQTTFANVSIGFPGEYPGRRSAMVLDM